MQTIELLKLIVKNVRISSLIKAAFSKMMMKTYKNCNKNKMRNIQHYWSKNKTLRNSSPYQDQIKFEYRKMPSNFR